LRTRKPEQAQEAQELVQVQLLEPELALWARPAPQAQLALVRRELPGQ